ncbi:hypothetical protein HHI36_010900 [Cryptolaemus montrouzieri]|uniref:Tetratricopeptide repeat protein 29 n=1 Tax=Cryptolaemus montrouzieri TaxID=559131 RepID=A0ABD2MK13_9CUCU
MITSELIKLCPGKRAAALKRIEAERKIKMRAKLPVLTREEVIRYRLPAHEAVIRAIKQDGFVNTGEFIKQLIDYQEYVRNFYGPDTNIWLRPRLMFNMDLLYHLRDGLCRAEKAHMIDHIGTEVNEMLKLAVEYAFGDEDWWWLGHQLLDQSIIISKDFKKDGGMHHATARYIFGKFLLEKITDVDAALEHLNIARNMSVGTAWTARGIFQDYQRSIFTEVSILLYLVILKQARKCMKSDTHLAIKLCKMARKAALDGCHYAGETEAYIAEGECEQLIYDTKSAITSFQKALAIQASHEDPKWKCEALSHLAVAYLKHGLLALALQMLHELREYAHMHQLIFYVAQAYKYLGEYYLREGTPKNSTPLLKIALKLFNEQQYIAEAESTRNYAAISIGIELINSYIQLVVDCVDTNQDYEQFMKKLIGWKDSRKTFWQDLKGEISFRSLEDMKNEDEEDFLIHHQADDQMLSKEVVLSVLSLIDSKDSFYASGSRKSIKAKDDVGDQLQNSSMEKSTGTHGNENTDDEDKKLVTLHIAENFEDD